MEMGRYFFSNFLLRCNQARIWAYLDTLSDDWYYKNELASQLDALDDGFRILSLVESEQESNDEKIDWLLDDMARNHYLVSVCFGDPDSGKSALGGFVLSELKKRCPGWRVFYYDTFKKPDFCDRLVYSLHECEPHSFTYFDELGKAFPARNFQDASNQAMTSATIDLRHQDEKYFGCAQKARLVDINYLMASNYKFFKYITPDNLLLDRVQVVTPFIQLFLPTLSDFKFRKSHTLCVTPSRIMYIDFPLPEFHTVDFSKNLADISEDLLKRYCRAKIESPKDIDRVRKMIRIRFKKEKPLSWFQSLL